MCVIAGYAGARQAAPILLEMIERQEGLAGGYYTGVATVESGRLHWRKVVGVTADLRGQTDAEKLPGRVGIAHSRSNSGGGVEWGHPFIACEASLAYVANGSAGVWKDHPSRLEIPRRLAREGHVYHALSPAAIGDYPTLDDGRGVHMSDVMAHLVEDALRRTGEPEAAIATALLEMPSEIVGLFVAPAHPDAVYGARRNFPACVGMDDDGAYIASSPEGLPCSVRWWTWVPPSSSFTVKQGRLSVSPLGQASAAIVDDVDRAEAREALVKAMSQGKALHMEELLKVVDPLSASLAPKVRYDPVYEVLAPLTRSGRVRRTVARVEGAAPGVTGVRFLHEMVK
ncbi:MAG TPA: hypothetical protein P5137_00275 [Candidatus Brocadiia bacterium]|mgnify:CR=1 FL=1|nr:hypothetical protein [Candidatus Brocadiia bacterium]